MFVAWCVNCERAHRAFSNQEDADRAVERVIVCPTCGVGVVELVAVIVAPMTILPIEKRPRAL